MCHNTYDGALQCGITGLLFFKEFSLANWSVYLVPPIDDVSVRSLKITTDLCCKQENISEPRINVFYQYNISMGH